MWKSVVRFPWTAISFALLARLRCYAERRSFSNSLFLACCMRCAASGIADRRSDALESIDAESAAQVLCWFLQSQQSLQRRLVALVADAFAALRIDLNIGLGAGRW